MQRIKYLVYLVDETVPLLFNATSKKVLKLELERLGYRISSISTKY